MNFSIYILSYAKVSRALYAQLRRCVRVCVCSVGKFPTAMSNFSSLINDCAIFRHFVTFQRLLATSSFGRLSVFVQIFCMFILRTQSRFPSYIYMWICGLHQQLRWYTPVISNELMNFMCTQTGKYKINVYTYRTIELT